MRLQERRKDNQDASQGGVHHSVHLVTVPTVHQLGRHPKAERYWPVPGHCEYEHQMARMEVVLRFQQLFPSWQGQKFYQDT